MRIKASISVKKKEGYIFMLHESEPVGFPEKFKVIFEEFNYYDGKDDQIVLVKNPVIESDIYKVDNDNFEATFKGVFYFEIPDEKFDDFIESNDTKGIDYSIYLSSIDKEIELYSDDDWEFVENSNIQLQHIEAI